MISLSFFLPFSKHYVAYVEYSLWLELDILLYIQQMKNREGVIGIMKRIQIVLSIHEMEMTA